jgi:hypothetical protein
MIVCTTWKSRPLAPEQARRMMEVWAKTEAKEAESTAVERLCWYIATDGSSGVAVTRYTNPEAAAAEQLEVSLALGEFIEFDSKVVLDMETALPPIQHAMQYM